MLEIKITASEIAEALNNLAKAFGALPTGVILTDDAKQAEPMTAELTVNPTVPVSAPQTVAVAPNAQNVSCPTDGVTAPVQSAPVQTVPTSAPQYTLEMLAKAGTALIDAGKMNELSALLAKYGVEALTSLNPAQYGVFANELRGMGAAI